MTQKKPVKQKKRILNLFGGFGKEKDVPPPQKTAGVKALPAQKAGARRLDSHVMEAAKEIARGLSTLVIFHYLAEDRQTVLKRRVTIRRIFKRGEQIMVEGFCHEREAPRIFIGARIKAVEDLNSGEVHNEPREFLLGQLAALPGEAMPGHSGAAQALNKVRDELTCLVFLAHVDGELDETEKRVVKNYIKRRCEGIRYNPDDIDKHLSRLYPDEDSFYAAMEKVLDDPYVLGDFVEVFVRLILADGMIHDEEREFLAELLHILREEGIEVDIPGL